MSEGNLGRISITVDTIDAEFIDTATPEDNPPRKTLSIIRIMTTAGVLSRLTGENGVPSEGTWVKLAVTQPTPQQPLVWISSAEDDYASITRGSLESLELINADVPPAPVGSAVAPIALVHTRLMKRFDLGNVANSTSSSASIQKIFNSVTMIRSAIVHDVGQASLCSVQCEFTGEKQGEIFVDAGLPLPFNKRSLPLFTTFNARRARALILTHWDWDHISAARVNLQGVSAFSSALWIAPRQVLGPNAFVNIFKPQFDSGRIFLMGGIRAIRFPKLTLLKGQGTNRNNSGIGVLARLNKKRRLLFPGDAKLGHGGLRCRGVLHGICVPHHGARTGSIIPLPAVTNPVAAVSVGHPNVYGHPDPNELMRFANAGWQVLQTCHNAPGPRASRYPQDIPLP